LGDQVRVDVAKYSNDLFALTKKPEEFFRPNPQVAESISTSLKFFFEYAKSCEQEQKVIKKPLGVLKELYVQNIDPESLWEQLEIRNQPLLKVLDYNINKLVSSKEISLAADILNESSDDEGVDDDDHEDGVNDVDDDKDDENDDDDKNDDGNSDDNVDDNAIGNANDADSVVSKQPEDSSNEEEGNFNSKTVYEIKKKAEALKYSTINIDRGNKKERNLKSEEKK